MADQTIQFVFNRAQEKIKNLPSNHGKTKKEIWNETCDELAQEMKAQQLQNTAKAIESLKVNH